MEPIASPTRSDLLQKINEKKYHVNSDYLLREIAGEDTIQNSALNFVHDTLRYALLEEVISL